ncbi:DUF6705 family protein [Chryseobacterium kwangjuense]|uniref:DUF6705 family protein n=1 Tax=Chryseobacterium kwangjuense TaxID=267125 RepID=A0ABW9JYC8_9FLAO
MKKIYTALSLGIVLFCKSQQIFPLATKSNELPANSYIKDIDNQLPAFEGEWKGNWNNKTLIIIFKKFKNYDTISQKNPYYIDLLYGRFQVRETNGKILFDNLLDQDTNSKIQGLFITVNGNYQLLYMDPDLCNKVGLVTIGFTESSKTELKLRYKDYPQNLDSKCFYYGKPADQHPEPLPKEIILTKQ